MKIFSQYITTNELAEKLGLSAGRVRQLVSQGRLQVAAKIGNINLFRSDAYKSFERKTRGRKPKT